jgi:hypothetical protein
LQLVACSLPLTAADAEDSNKCSINTTQCYAVKIEQNVPGWYCAFR